MVSFYGNAFFQGQSIKITNIIRWLYKSGAWCFLNYWQNNKSSQDGIFLKKTVIQKQEE
jgi:hypothetical protein